MKDRVPTFPGRVTLTPVAGQTNTYDMVRADAPVEAGTPLNKANLMPDTLATTLALNPLTATVADGILAAYTKAVADAKKRTVIFDAAPASSPFVVDMSAIDFSKVNRLGIEFFDVSTATSAQYAYAFLRNASNTEVARSPGVDIQKDSIYGSRGVAVFSFVEKLVHCAQASATNATTGLPTAQKMESKAVVNNMQISINGFGNSIATRKVVVWYD